MSTRNKKTIGAIAMTAALAGGGLFGATLGNPLASGAQESGSTAEPSADTSPDAPADKGERGGQRGPSLDAAAGVLGMTNDELRSELQADRSLAEIAAEKGVDKQEVIDALVAAGEARLDEAASELPTRMAELVERKFDGEGRGGRGGPGRGHGGEGADAAADSLGITREELRTEIQAGKTLAEVAADRGIDKQVVVDALVAEAQAHIAEKVASGNLTQEEADARLAEVAEKIATRVDEGRPERGGRGN